MSDVTPMTQPAVQKPSSPEELRDALRGAASKHQQIEVLGNNSKRLLGGPAAPAQARISTEAMRRILQYEPRDLTVSVEAGMPFAALQAELARNGQMIPLDGAFAENATVGGMVAANISGPRRRWYGTARDLVIGMRFVTVDGRIVNTGGMVVKNVAGLDMAKVLIGSYGTLAAIASVNFKLTPRPVAERTFLFRFEDAKTAGEAVARVLQSQFAPLAIEVLNPLLSAQMNLKGFTLALGFGGNERVIDRITQQIGSEALAIAGVPFTLMGEDERKFWRSLQLVPPRFLEKFGDGAIVRVSTPISQALEALALSDAVGMAHAGSGVVRGFFTRPDAAVRYLNNCLQRGWHAIIEGAGENVRSGLTLWPNPGEDFEIMKKIKEMFDPEGLLNRGRLLQRL